MSKEFECPSCEKVVDEYPALSRKDNKTEICSECGQKEALTIYRKNHDSWGRKIGNTF